MSFGNKELEFNEVENSFLNTIQKECTMDKERIIIGSLEVFCKVHRIGNYEVKHDGKLYHCKGFCKNGVYFLVSKDYIFENILPIQNKK